MASPDEPQRFPRRVGRYEILVPIATGGTATVYLAAPAGEEAPLVALKLPHAHLADAPGASPAIEMVEEARLAARVEHPNVVRILDVGIDPLGFFLVMEHVDGVSLAHLLRALAGAGVPVEVARRVLDDALAGLAAAHAATDAQGRNLGIVHRDFSPQNILVGVDGRARLTDFGIARATGRAQLTQVGIVKGKAAYMSPEQAQGLALDQRSDVWSAGVVAWEMFAGRPLYPTDDPLATMLRIVNESPPRLGSVRPDLPSAVEAAIARALAADPAARWAGVDDLRAGLASAFEDGGAGMAPHEGVAEVLLRACGNSRESWRREVESALVVRRQTAVRSRRARRQRWGAGIGVAVLGTALAVGLVSRGPPPPGPSATQAKRIRPAPIIVASAQGFPRWVEPEGDHVYWSSRDGVFRAPKSGKPWFFPVAAADDVRGLAVDERFVYFAEYGAGRVARVEKAGSPPITLATLPRPEALIIDATHVYVASGETGGIWRFPQQGGASEVVVAGDPSATDRRVCGLALDGTDIYWTDQGTRTVNRAPRAGGAPAVLARTGPEPYGLALDANTVYWRDGTISDGRLLAVPKRGGDTRVLIGSGESFPRGIAVDATGIYFTAGAPSAGRIERILPDGSGRTTLAEGQLGVHGISLDGEYVYYTAWGGGSVWKVAKE